MGMDSFAPGSRNPNCFVVQNITHPKKLIHIFHYPIHHGRTRDLLKIPGVAEDDIRASLLKGEIKHKILCRDIIVLCSDIDLLQFNATQKAFLQSAGIVNGLSVDFPELTQEVVDAINAGGGGGDGYITYLFRQRQTLVGAINGTNRVFTTPNSDKFIDGIYNNNEFHIYVTHNGHGMKYGIDYLISESGGAGTGYDTITFISFTPIHNRSIIEATYVIKSP